MPPAWQAGGSLLVWAALSVGLSLYNKWLLGRQVFNFPMCLSCAHMAGAALLLNAYTAWRRGAGVKGVCLRDDVLEAGRGPLMAGTAGIPAVPALVAGQGKGTLAPPPPSRASFAVTATASTSSSSADTGHGIQAACRPAESLGWAQEQAWWARRHGRRLAPIALAFAASVCLRNSAFAGLPLPVMQLVGACAPLVAFAASVAVGLVTLTLPRLASIGACAAGVAIAISDRLVPFSGPALARHAAGIGLEVCRSIMLQLLIREVEGGGGGGGPTKHDATTAAKPPSPSCAQQQQRAKAGAQARGGDGHPASAVPLPTTLLAVYAPLCAAMLAAPAAALELRPALADATGRPPWFWLACAGNVAVALAYNLASISCLQHAGVMAMSLTGFAKDWGLVVLSTLLFGREVTPRFMGGMAAVTAAVAAYTHCR